MKAAAACLMFLAFLAANAEEGASQAAIYSANALQSEKWYLVVRDENNNNWLDPKPYDAKSAKAIIAGIDKSRKWDGVSHAAAYGMLHAHPPAVTFSLTTVADTIDIKQGVNALTICYGNHHFWFGDSLFQTDDAGFAALKTAFPNNCFDSEK